MRGISYLRYKKEMIFAVFFYWKDLVPVNYTRSNGLPNPILQILKIRRGNTSSDFSILSGFFCLHCYRISHIWIVEISLIKFNNV